MRGDLAPDEALLQRLPLPLAQLYRRACNAKTALERHQAAYYLWEASLKLLACAALVEHAARGPLADPKLAERLQNLARPSLGHWWEFVRLLVPALADAGDTGFARVGDPLLGRERDHRPMVKGPATHSGVWPIARGRQRGLVVRQGGLRIRPDAVIWYWWADERRPSGLGRAD